MIMDKGDSQDTCGPTTGDNQVTKDLTGGEEQVQESSNHDDNTVAQEAADETTPRSEKHKADPRKWKKNININKRAKGKAYLGRKYEKGGSKYTISEKTAKVIGDRCSYKTVKVRRCNR
ncbi:hypothetical protein PoB_005590300 [Plakobranchus ocellatus]|uniref:Uncharacterized protein n=1 Tax=Plakobranchus ocellatus TaxID=259542 RepID=A0AAV4CEL6_9GAST|nr:hypothetical protein PoB_005590300 [Plakobranchus ocellatus]